MKKSELTKIQFKEAFKRGLGYSYIQLKNSSNREKYKDIVLWACLRNTCYDMQCEGGRSSFLYDAICLFEDKKFFEDAIIQKFMRSNQDSWLFDQLCEILFLFSLDGSMKAKESLHAKYNTLIGRLFRASNTEKENLESLCIRLTSLDGFSAFETIVNQLGEYNLKNKHTLNMDWFYSNAKNEFGDERVDTYLQKHSATSSYIQYVLKSVSQTGIQNESATEPPTVEEFIKATRERRSRGLSLRLAKVATENDLIKLAQYAVKETDVDVKLELLWPFRKVRFPLDEQIIFELAESADPSIRYIAFEMLHHLSSDRTHDYAINLIRQKKEIHNALGLLCFCYTVQDEALLFEGIRSLTVSYDDGEWHSVFMNAEQLLDNDSIIVDSSLFVYMYRQSLCSACRSRLIKKMFKRSLLSPEILEECLYDSNEDIRNFANSKLNR